MKMEQKNSFFIMVDSLCFVRASATIDFVRDVAANLFARGRVVQPAREIVPHPFERFSAPPLQLPIISLHQSVIYRS
jgi:hypothetical protein